MRPTVSRRSESYSGRLSALRGGGRRLGYEALEGRRLMAIMSAITDGVLEVELDAANDAATIRVAGANIEVFDGTVVKGRYPAVDVKRLEIGDKTNNSSNDQSVVLQDALYLPDGLSTDYYIESVAIDGDVMTQGTDVNADTDVHLNANIVTDGGSVDFGSVILGAGSFTINTASSDEQTAGSVTLRTIDGPGGLIINANAERGIAGDVSFEEVGSNARLSGFEVMSSGRIRVEEDTIRTDGPVTLAGSVLELGNNVLAIDSQSKSDAAGGNVTLDVATLRWADTVHVNTSGGNGHAAGIITLPLGFERLGSSSAGVVFREPLTGTRIVVNKEAVESAFADYGDAPETYDKRAGVLDAARHFNDPSIAAPVFLGSSIDYEALAQSSSDATGDDAPSSMDDENGVQLPASLAPGQTATIRVDVFGTGRLYAWIDFNADGDFDGDERVTGSGADPWTLVNPGQNLLNVSVPSVAKTGTTIARFRVTTATSALPSIGPAANGEVEDYQVTIGIPTTTAPPLFSDDFTGNVAKAEVKVQEASNQHLAGDRYQASPKEANGHAITIIDPLTLPLDYSVSARTDMSGTAGGQPASNSLLIFDFVDKGNYKFAGAADGVDQYVIGEMVGGVPRKLRSLNALILSNTEITLRIDVRGDTVTLLANNAPKLTHTFATDLNANKVGFGTLYATTQFDDLIVRAL